MKYCATASTNLETCKNDSQLNWVVCVSRVHAERRRFGTGGSRRAIAVGEHHMDTRTRAQQRDDDGHLVVFHRDTQYCMRVRAKWRKWTRRVHYESAQFEGTLKRHTLLASARLTSQGRMRDSSSGAPGVAPGFWVLHQGKPGIQEKFFVEIVCFRGTSLGGLTSLLLQFFVAPVLRFQ